MLYGFVLTSFFVIISFGQLWAQDYSGKIDSSQTAASDSTELVDLSEEEQAYFGAQSTASHVLANSWFNNLDISGFGATGYFKTGGTGAHPNGSFVLKESSLFIEANAWKNISFFFELYVNFLLQDQQSSVRTAEVYAHFRDVIKDGYLNIKVGRIDIPFGEEYLWNDSSDNMMISHSAAFPWLWDEGILLYGKVKNVGWILSVMDGAMARSSDDDASKAWVAKLYGTPTNSLYLSASVMQNGESAMSAIYIGGHCFQPVGMPIHGVPVAATLGSTPSEKVSSALYELDAKYTFSNKGELWLSFGRGFLNDNIDEFDRDFTWFTIQPHFNFNAQFYAILRYSEIGTYDSERGYLFGGEFITGGRFTYGYDTKRLQRGSFGLGWTPNPRTAIKFEIGRDKFQLIDASPLDASGDNRDFISSEVVLSF